jgi:hypothetical protein
VGIRTDIAALARIADSFASVPDANTGIRSPFAGDLTRIVVPDLLSLFGIDDWTCFGREQAMSLPGVFRARAILLSLIADKPLQSWRGAALLPAEQQASFLYRTPGVLGPWQRMARTLDDLIFYPWSLWITQRGGEPGDDGRRPILNAVHCPYESWQVNELGLIELKNQDGGWDVADDDEVLLIPGPSEGLIAYATRTLSGSAAIEQAWVSRAQNPSPITELHLTDDSLELTAPEMVATQESWVNARRAKNGAVAVTPANVEVIDHGSSADANLYIEGRNSSRMDIASFFNLPGAILDASQAQASLTYVTEQNTRSSVYDLTLPYWVRPIESRFSQDDVVPRGQRVAFDFTTLAPTAPGPVSED